MYFQIVYFTLIYLTNSIHGSIANAPPIINVDRIPISELFSFKIEPKLFNWTFQGVTEQFTYRPSLKDYPDLPSWLRYMYSTEYHAGFLYGTPTENLANKEIQLDIVGLNKHNYETRQIILNLNIIEKLPATNLIQMKIDNLNWIHLMDPGRVENLKNIFRKDLWPLSNNDLHLVFMESAVKMGGRVPLRPQQREGVIVHLGSNAPFSDRLIELQEEIRPLYKLSTCTYKRTSVQKIFENVGFKLDWCGFRIVSNDLSSSLSSSSPELLYHMNNGVNYNSINKRLPSLLTQSSSSSSSSLSQNSNSGASEITIMGASGSISTAITTGSSANTLLIKNLERWDGIHKSEVPDRNYIDEFAFAFAIPGMIFAILIAVLSAVLCFYHENLRDDYSENFFQNIFHICEDYYFGSSDNMKSSTVQMVHCTYTNNQPTTTLKSLKDPNLLIDNISINSQSPANTGNSYLRPPPPTYKPPSIGKNCVDI